MFLRIQYYHYFSFHYNAFQNCYYSISHDHIQFYPVPYLLFNSPCLCIVLFTVLLSVFTPFLLLLGIISTIFTHFPSSSLTITSYSSLLIPKPFFSIALYPQGAAIYLSFLALLIHYPLIIDNFMNPLNLFIICHVLDSLQAP